MKAQYMDTVAGISHKLGALPNRIGVTTVQWKVDGLILTAGAEAELITESRVTTKGAVKIQSKTVIKEAIQLTENNVEEVYGFMYPGEATVDHSNQRDSERFEDYVSSVRRSGLRLKTLESDGETQVADIGDWIIKGLHGEFYPCKPDIFQKSYEIIGEEIITIARKAVEE